MTPGRLDDTQWHDAAAATDTAAVLIIGQRTDPARRRVDDDRPAGADRAEGAEGVWLDQVAGYRAEIYQAAGMVQVRVVQLPRACPPDPGAPPPIERGGPTG